MRNVQKSEHIFKTPQNKEFLIYLHDLNCQQNSLFFILGRNFKALSMIASVLFRIKMVTIFWGHPVVLIDRKCRLLFSTKSVIDRHLKLGPHIKNTWEFCWQLKSYVNSINYFFCEVLTICSPFWTSRIECVMFRMRVMV